VALGLGALSPRRGGFATTPITDASIKHLAECKQLSEIELFDTKLTSEGKQKLVELLSKGKTP